ncbi:MAG: hypothetical protein N2C14_31170, partial [Planctomycetales bacterium]
IELTNLPALQSVEIDFTRQREVSMITNELPSLQKFVVSGKFPLSALQSLRNCPMLKVIRSEFYGEHTGLGFEYLGEFSNLEELSLGYYETISDDDLRHLRKLSNLQRLEIVGANINGKGLEHLTELTSITSISLAFNPLSDLSALQQLRFVELDLTGVRLSDLLVNQLARLHVRQIVVDGMINDAKLLQRLKQVLQSRFTRIRVDY